MQKQSLADKLGIFFSSLCALHCLILPIVIINSGSLLSKYINNQWVEKGFIITCLTIAAFSFLKYKKQHGNLLPLVLLVIAVIFLILSMATPNFVLEIVLSVIGSSILICGHIINMRSCKLC
jgi:MerC mercury resistance protein